LITLQWSENALEFLHEEIAGSNKLIPVFSITNNEYNWNKMLALFSAETKKFYWAAGSGCECCETLTTSVKDVSKLTEGSESELKQALRTFISHNSGIITDDEKQKIFSKIKKQK
jgi:hypothetical protein